MKKSLLLILVSLLLLSAVPAVSAQEGTTVTTTEENGTTTTTTTTAPGTTTSGDDSGVNIDVGSILSADDSTDKQTVIRSWSTGYVTDMEAYPEQDKVVLTLVLERSQTLTFSDGQGINPEKQSGTYFVKSMSLPKGTVEIAVEATRKDNNQVVSINGGDIPSNEAIWVSTGNEVEDENRSVLANPTTLGITLGAMAVMGLGAIWHIRDWMQEQSADGPPRTADGVKLPEDSKYGDLEEVEEAEQAGGGDE